MSKSADLWSVADALDNVLQHVQPLPPVAAPLGPGLLGLVLAQDVASDLDLPPFDKALMDGYAVRAADRAAPLQVIEEVTAGRVPEHAVGPGQATRIMTGAPMPAGADTVIPVELSRLLDDGRVALDAPRAAAGQNIMRQGREMRCGETVLTRGCVLRPQEIGVLGAVGRALVQVHPAPTVAVLPTGDEIVDVHQTPQPGQIRNSNGPMLLAQTARACGQPRDLGIARDDVDHLRGLIEQGLTGDVLLLSGGVSAGKLDLVPGVLRDLGVTAHFHKVAMKPGKPIFFGTRGRTLVFGLPGNPVSSLVCFELFVRPALRGLRGLADPGPLTVPARLAEPFAHRADRPTYYPAQVQATDGGWLVKPVPWFGSPDLRGLTAADAFVIIPPGEHQFAAGDALPVLRVDQMG